MHKLLLLLVILGLAHGVSASALAQEKIGGTTVVKKEVHGDMSGRSSRLAVGDHVYLDEVISTAVESLARIKFQDSTDLHVGPSSSVKLDSHVYSRDSGARSLIFKTTKGAFRFVTPGRSGNEVHTPTAIIAIRG